MLDLSKVRSRRSMTTRQSASSPSPRAITVQPPERPPGASVDRRPAPAPAVSPTPRGSISIRGWSTMHLASFAVLLASSLVLAAIVYQESVEEESTPAASRAASSATPALPVAPAEAGPFVMPPLDTYAEVTARPLFSPGRRPAAAAQQLTGPASSLALAGVVISRDGRVALIRSGKGPALVRVKEGQQVDGWTVRSIAADHVVVRSGATEAQLKLHESAPAARNANDASAQ